MIAYKQIPEVEVHGAVDRFLGTQPDNIPDEEFDRIFDNTRDALLTVGSFNEGSRNGANFASSRYVDQIPCIGISVDDDFPPDRLIEAALIAQSNAHRPYAIIFDLYPDCIVALPDALVGTVELNNHSQNMTADSTASRRESP